MVKGRAREKMLETSALSEMALEVRPAKAVSKRLLFLAASRSFWALVRMAANEVPVGALEPLRVIAPLGLTEYWTTLRPTWKEFWPFNVIDMEIELLELKASVRSARRPPQPEAKALSAMLLCHSTCWSLWEKSDIGSGTERARYWARVVGTASVPTLAMNAIWPESKRDFRPVVLVPATSALKLG